MENYGVEKYGFVKIFLVMKLNAHSEFLIQKIWKKTNIDISLKKLITILENH